MNEDVKQVTDASFQQDVVGSDLPAIVDFWAPWCGPCRMMAPVFDELATEFAGKALFAKMNVDENPDTPGKLGVRGIPTLIIYRGGQEAERIVGFAPKQVLRGKLEAYLPKESNA